MKQRDLDSLRNFLFSAGPHPIRGLGILDALPVEILHGICCQLDIASLLRFRHVNRQARHLVHAIYGYQTVITHAVGALCAMLRIGTLSWFTYHELLNVLYTRDCCFCGSFGSYIFLPLLLRCCIICLENASQLRLVSLNAFRRHFMLNWAAARKSFPNIKAIPGIYTSAELPCKLRNRYVAEAHLPREMRT